MQETEWRWRWWQHLLGPMIVLIGCLLLLASPIAYPWRISLVTLVLIAGLFTWQRYLASRPLRLRMSSDGRLSCVRTDGQEVDIERVLVGVAHPRLLSARLTLVDDRQCHLWVPGRAMQPESHRRLRAQLLHFRNR
jgi:hypothetical protein